MTIVYSDEGQHLWEEVVIGKTSDAEKSGNQGCNF